MIHLTNPADALTESVLWTLLLRCFDRPVKMKLTKLSFLLIDVSFFKIKLTNQKHQILLWRNHLKFL
jgi:hypothetical protein